MNLHRKHLARLALLVAACCLTGRLTSAEPTTEGVGAEQKIRFFENSVRPILFTHCIACHGPKKQESGFRLDLRSAAFRGGDNGPSIVPGQPDDSLLIDAVSWKGDIRMPPESRLSDEQVEVLRKWIQSGAYWPASLPAEGANPGESHWAFQPLTLSPVVEPPPNAAKWAENEIDLFIFSKQAEQVLSPATEADRRTLLRRISLDLTGLPPTLAEVNAFIADRRPDAYSQAVDRFLASPRYGERWGRFWLDVARYADNKGYVFFEEKNFPWAWTYRDYVVRSFNGDLPYDQFVMQQIAADQMDLGDDRQPLAAMGFLTVGAHFTNNSHDVIDDRIDVVTRGLMGLTVTCARCHDHKFDPIPQADYYSLYGVFRSSVEPTLGPMLHPTPTSEAYVQYAADLSERVRKLEEFVDAQRTIIMTKTRERVADYLLAVYAKRNQPSTENFMLLTEKGDLVPAIIHRWESYLKRAKQTKDPIWLAWHQFADLPDDELAANVGGIYERMASDTQQSVHPLILARLIAEKPPTIKDIAEVYGQLLSEADRQWEELLKPTNNEKASNPNQLSDAHWESLRQVLYAGDSPAVVPRTLSWGFLDLLPDRSTQGEFKVLIKEVEQFSVKPPAPPRAMVLQDLATPYEPVIFLRGNPNREGPLVPRQFLQLIAGHSREPFGAGSGRLELAREIASDDNPLTARVIVNRVWRHHFGRGIVETPSDFGRQGEQPSHHALLDWLALRFIQDGWSIKRLHRLILHSATYRQSNVPQSCVAARAEKLDPANRLLTHFSRSRLDFESMRDSLLFVSGRLDNAIGGPPGDLLAPANQRRSLYGFIDRMDLPNLLRSFDFPDPAATSPKRDETTIPAQSLFFMNHPIVIGCANALAADKELLAIKSPSDRAIAAFRRVTSRSPTSVEVDAIRHYFPQDSPAAEQVSKRESGPSQWKYGYGTVLKDSHEVTAFTPLSFWTGTRWQGGAKLPDANIGWVFVERDGAHPGATYDRCVIRRWTSPLNGKVQLDGILKHVPNEGNGVRGKLISSRHGLLGQWTVHHSEQPTRFEEIEVARGDTLDLVVDFQDQITHDEHLWWVTIRTLEGVLDQAAGVESGSADRGHVSDSRIDFRGKTTDRWPAYVHALLMMNELAFVD
jgi:cytochrome c553